MAGTTPQTFAEAHRAATKQTDAWLQGMDDEDLTDAEQTRLEIGVVDASAKAVLGIWRELHRIANALDKRP